MPGAYLYGFDEDTGLPVKCRVTAQGKLIVNASGFLENPPTEDEDKKAPTSEWAYDHWKAAAAHHAKYTDVESRAAIGNQFSSTGKALKALNMGYKTVNYANPFNFRVQASDDYQIGISKVNDTNRLLFICNHFGVGLEDVSLECYTGSGYTKIIRADTFLANLLLFLENPPVEDEAEKAPTSEWAYDHWKDASAHHERYYDKEAVDAFQSRDRTFTNGTYTNTDVTSVSMIWLDSTDGDILIKGLAGGYNGKIIILIVSNNNNDTVIYHNNGDAAAGDKILTPAGGDYTIGYGNTCGLIFVYKNSYWRSLFTPL